MKINRIKWIMVFALLASSVLFFNVVIIYSPTVVVPSYPLTYNLNVSDPNNLLGTSRAGVLANFDAAIQDWGRYINSPNRLNIQMRVTGTTASGRFGGSTSTSRYIGTWNGFNIFEDASIAKLKSNISLATYDIYIDVNVPFMKQYYWIDPSPSTRTTPVPVGKTDLVTVFAHELGHAFGMNGWINRSTGATPSNLGISVYDKFISATSRYGEGGVKFAGPKSKIVYGAPVPVFFTSYDHSEYVSHNGSSFNCSKAMSQNNYHLGHFSNSFPESDKSFFSLMAGAWPWRSSSQGLRIRVTQMDAAVLYDLGIPMKSGVLP
jgi:hypothetical protein